MTEKTEDHKKRVPVVQPLSTTHSKQVGIIRQLRRLFKTKSASIIAVLLVAGLPSYYFYHKSVVANQKLNNPTEANKKAIDEVVFKASRHIILPTGEQPTMASVSDVEKVKGQPFFANAQNGDKVLVYTQARKAYLYRPSKDIIVEVAPLNIDTAVPAGQ